MNELPIANRFFSFYRDRGRILKLILSILLPLMAILWVIGSLTVPSRLVMFTVGLLAGAIGLFFLARYGGVDLLPIIEQVLRGLL